MISLLSKIGNYIFYNSTVSGIILGVFFCTTYYSIFSYGKIKNIPIKKNLDLDLLKVIILILSSVAIIKSLEFICSLCKIANLEEFEISKDYLLEMIIGSVAVIWVSIYSIPQIFKPLMGSVFKFNKKNTTFIPVIYNEYDGMVEAKYLDELIKEKRILAFQRSTGWAYIERDKMRGMGGFDYPGNDRRRATH